MRGTVSGDVRPPTVIPVGGAAVNVTGPGAIFPTEPIFKFAETLPPGAIESVTGSIVMSIDASAGEVKLGCEVALTLELVALVTFTE